MEDIVILIPAYKPDKEIMIEFLGKLKNKFKNIVIVNDGSGAKFDDFFKKLENDKIPVIHHDKNKGKVGTKEERNQF